jgi:hypothetical protein
MVSRVLPITSSKRRSAVAAGSPALCGLLAALLGMLVANTQTWAQGASFPGTRPLGMGGAMRAIATGDAGAMLNPSGISLMRSYSLEGGYQYGKTPDSHDMRISAVDSTSGFNLGGALYYAYHRDSPSSGVSQSGHLAGGSLSFPFLDKVSLGANVKYLHFRDTADSTHSGLTIDAGITLRPLSQLSIGAVGYNLLEVATAWMPLGVGGGLAFLPLPQLLFTFDMVWTKVYGDPARDHVWSFMGGGEFSLTPTAAIRAGGGRDGLTKNGYLSAGLTMLAAELGAIDLGVRQDVSGETRNTFLGVTARLFVPGI